MPTVLTHAVVPLAIVVGLGRKRIPPRLMIAGIVAAMLPDLDVVGLRFGVAYAHAFGHRGATHSVLAALCLGLIGALAAPWFRASRRCAALFLFAATLSHPLLDMLTNGGLGIALGWPFSSTRYFFPTRPIIVSPLGLHRLLSQAGWHVASSEWRCVWLPAIAVAALCRTALALTAKLTMTPSAAPPSCSTTTYYEKPHGFRP